MIEDEGSFHSSAGVSSTAVSPEPIPILAPVRDSVRFQKAVKGCGTKDCPYDLDFTPSVVEPQIREACVFGLFGYSHGRS